jgi:hypothetical protein
MKIQDKIVTSEGNAIYSQTTAMTIDENSLSFIIRSLTDMYSDPMRAVVREYAGNAYDSHILACQDRAVEFTTPNTLNPGFVIQDFGVGMSREELTQVYSKYGASTKRNTNDQIGAFGLGSKSALAIANSFVVVSVQDGKSNTVIVNKGDNNIPVFKFLDEVETTNPDGVRIEIPISNSYDIKKALESMFLGWPLNSAKVDGKFVGGEVHDEKKYTRLGDAGWISTSPTATERSYYNPSSLKVLVGPVSYSMTANEIESTFGHKFGLDKTLGNLVLNLPIGSVEFTPSRESFIFNAVTKNAIEGRLNALRDLVAEHVSTKLSSAKNEDEALDSFMNFVAMGLDVDGITWNGEEIPVSKAAYYGAWRALNVTADDKKIVHASSVIQTRQAVDRNAGKYVYRTSASHNDIKKDKREFTVNDRKNVIVVTDAKRSEKNNKRFGAQDGISLYVTDKYATEFATDASVTVLFFEDSVDKLSSWVTNTVREVLTEATVIDEARRVRRERRAAAPKKQKEETTKQRAKFSAPIFTYNGERQSTFFGSSNESNYKIVSTDIDSLDKDTKFVVIQQEKLNSGKISSKQPGMDNDGLELIVANYNGLVNGNYGFRGSNFNLATGVLNLLWNAGYRVISLPVTGNKARLIERLPNNYSILEALESALKDVPVVTPVERIVINDQAKTYGSDNNKWTELFAKNGVAVQENLDLIDSEETRNRLTFTLRKNKNEFSRAEILAAVFNLLAGKRGYRGNLNEVAMDWNGSPLVSILSKFSSVKAAEEKGTYPLLKNAYVYDLKVEDVAEYINMRDAKNI